MVCDLPESRTCKQMPVRGMALSLSRVSNAQILGATNQHCCLSYWRGVATVEASARRCPMFLALAIILFIVWIASFVLFKTAGFLIHLLLLFAIISIIMHFISGRRAVR